ncbi:hypothetical protein ElyMa_000854700 [Elysia marginata]|uniref:Uncharacterized protein n=1 Tax=Elysia marginata TaxID=1093978 RepID=A0AAV4H2X6_9GAST|nr:hypothetical protein ElyMa_000854700 [Elysia marginata]
MLCEDPPGRHAIELSTLKYVDSNPIDETLMAHRLPPPPQIPGRSSNRIHNKGTTSSAAATIRPPEESVGRGVGGLFTQEASCDVNVKGGLNANEILGTTSQHLSNVPKQQHLHEQQQPQDQQQKHQMPAHRPRQHSILPPSYAPINFLNPSGDGCGLNPPIRRLSCVSAVITHPHQQHQQQQRHGPSSGGGSGGGPGAGTGTGASSGAAGQPPTPPRRLPDFVTIDQCYNAAAADDQDCSTVCLIANFDVGGRGFGGVGGFPSSNANPVKSGTNFNNNNNNNNNINNAITNSYLPQPQLAHRRATFSANSNLQHQQQLQLHSHHPQQQQQQHQYEQHIDSSGTGTSCGAAGARKERSSLRRGIMMRQMSLNPSHEKDIHLVTGKATLT